MNRLFSTILLIIGGLTIPGILEAETIEPEEIVVVRGETVLVPGVDSSIAFKFSDGRIVVGKDDPSSWSTDGGKTWKRGPAGPGQKVAIDLGGGEVLSVSRDTNRLDTGLHEGQLKRSLDNWKTYEQEKPVLNIPLAASTVLGGGKIIDGFLFHHGIVLLPDGRLLASMYGNYRGDTILCDGYPTELGQLKYRTIVVSSNDRGRTWGNPVMVAYDRMLGRGIPSDHPRVELGYESETTRPTRVVPAVTQEGFREADLLIAPNGNLLCMMRSGGRNGGAAVLFPTPLYCSWSEDMGRSWSPPAQVADRGVGPDMILLRNGVIVCTYSRPGNWLIYSMDNGLTWQASHQFAPFNAYNYLVESGPDSFQVFHEANNEKKTKVYGTFFTVRKK